VSYLLLDLVFLAAAAVLAIVLSLRARPSRAGGKGGSGARRRPAPGAAPVAAGVALLVLTAVFDNAMIAAGLFSYAPEKLSGLALGLAPLEDFAYPLAAAILLPALWTRLARAERAEHAERAGRSEGPRAGHLSRPGEHGRAPRARAGKEAG
jgi:lycopene cyclase domain-containing protein